MSSESKSRSYGSSGPGPGPDPHFAILILQTKKRVRHDEKSIPDKFDIGPPGLNKTKQTQKTCASRKESSPYLTSLALGRRA